MKKAGELFLLALVLPGKHQGGQRNHDLLCTALGPQGQVPAADHAGKTILGLHLKTAWDKMLACQGGKTQEADCRGLSTSRSGRGRISGFQSSQEIPVDKRTRHLSPGFLAKSQCHTDWMGKGSG